MRMSAYGKADVIAFDRYYGMPRGPYMCAEVVKNILSVEYRARFLFIKTMRSLYF